MGAKHFLRACALATFGAVALSKPVDTHRRAAYAEAQKLADPSYGPVPGESPIFNTYWGKAPTWPGNLTDAVMPTKKGPPGVDDQVWQNLLAAEWIIFSFYQQAVEMFNESSFIAAGMPNTTYRRVQEIRNNEAGHLRIFQNQISETSVKPGACKYNFPLQRPRLLPCVGHGLGDLQHGFPHGSCAASQARQCEGRHVGHRRDGDAPRGLAIDGHLEGEPPGRPVGHGLPLRQRGPWQHGQPRGTRQLPQENPEYPTPNQHLPALGASKNTTSLAPGSTIDLAFTDSKNQPKFVKGKQYYAVFFHGQANETVPIDTCDWPKKSISVQIPAKFEEKGVIAAVLADTPGAPTKETIVAGPGIILEQPEPLGVKLL
ncbi:hypothetical protein PG994_014282 [Apiospora phragmitis]|uniref:Rds1 protein n=1 Tax=Apiospora phragmitis TaxID=2905665 RepID=A0ABR1T3V4_9PEZI